MYGINAQDGSSKSGFVQVMKAKGVAGNRMMQKGFANFLSLIGNALMMHNNSEQNGLSVLKGQTGFIPVQKEPASENLFNSSKHQVSLQFLLAHDVEVTENIVLDNAHKTKNVTGKSVREKTAEPSQVIKRIVDYKENVKTNQQNDTILKNNVQAIPLNHIKESAELLKIAGESKSLKHTHKFENETHLIANPALQNTANTGNVILQIKPQEAKQNTGAVSAPSDDVEWKKVKIQFRDFLSLLEKNANGDSAENIVYKNFLKSDVHQKVQAFQLIKAVEKVYLSDQKSEIVALPTAKNNVIEIEVSKSAGNVELKIPEKAKAEAGKILPFVKHIIRNGAENPATLLNVKQSLSTAKGIQPLSDENIQIKSEIVNAKRTAQPVLKVSAVQELSKDINNAGVQDKKSEPSHKMQNEISLNSAKVNNIVEELDPENKTVRSEKITADAKTADIKVASDTLTPSVASHKKQQTTAASKVSRTTAYINRESQKPDSPHPDISDKLIKTQNKVNPEIQKTVGQNGSVNINHDKAPINQIFRTTENLKTEPGKLNNNRLDHTVAPTKTQNKHNGIQKAVNQPAPEFAKTVKVVETTNENNLFKIDRHLKIKTVFVEKIVIQKAEVISNTTAKAKESASFAKAAVQAEAAAEKISVKPVYINTMEINKKAVHPTVESGKQIAAEGSAVKTDIKSQSSQDIPEAAAAEKRINPAQYKAAGSEKAAENNIRKSEIHSSEAIKNIDPAGKEKTLQENFSPKQNNPEVQQRNNENVPRVSTEKLHSAKQEANAESDVAVKVHGKINATEPQKPAEKKAETIKSEVISTDKTKSKTEPAESKESFNKQVQKTVKNILHEETSAKTEFTSNKNSAKDLAPGEKNHVKSDDLNKNLQQEFTQKTVEKAPSAAAPVHKENKINQPAEENIQAKQDSRQSKTVNIESRQPDTQQQNNNGFGEPSEREQTPVARRPENTSEVHKTERAESFNHLFETARMAQQAQAKPVIPLKELPALIQKYYDSQNQVFTQSQVVVDGGEIGKLEIRMNESAKNRTIVILVENESAKAEMQRLAPMIAESLNSKGVPVQAVNIDIGNPNSKNEKRNNSKNNPQSRLAAENMEGQHEQNTTVKQKRYYGYNSMDIEI